MLWNSFRVSAKYARNTLNGFVNFKINRKLIIFISIIMALATIFVVNMESTVTANGVLRENSKTTSVDIKITQKNFYHIFNRITGEIIAESEDKSYRYNFSGPIFEFEDYFAAPIYRMGDGLESHGYLYYDDEMKNIVIETDKEKIYAADEKFISNVCIIE